MHLYAFFISINIKTAVNVLCYCVSEKKISCKGIKMLHNLSVPRKDLKPPKVYNGNRLQSINLLAFSIAFFKACQFRIIKLNEPSQKYFHMGNKKIYVSINSLRFSNVYIAER